MGTRRLARDRLDDRPLIIFGVDPGKETGIVVYAGGKLIGKVSLPAADATPWIMNRLQGVDTEAHRIIIGVERYNFGLNAVKKTRQTDPTEITGQLKAVARSVHAFFLLVNQADSKKLGRDAVLRRIGWYTIGHGHINDGARVVLQVLAVDRPNEFASVVGL